MPPKRAYNRKKAVDSVEKVDIQAPAAAPVVRVVVDVPVVDAAPVTKEVVDVPVANAVSAPVAAELDDVAWASAQLGRALPKVKELPPADIVKAEPAPRPSWLQTQHADEPPAPAGPVVRKSRKPAALASQEVAVTPSTPPVLLEGVAPVEHVPEVMDDHTRYDVFGIEDYDVDMHGGF